MAQAVAPRQRGQPTSQYLGDTSKKSTTGFNFTGKVEQSGGGQPGSTTYYAGGTPIATTSGTSGTYTGAGGTYKQTYSSGEQVTIKPTVVESISPAQKLEAQQAASMVTAPAYQSGTLMSVKGRSIGYTGEPLTGQPGFETRLGPSAGIKEKMIYYSEPVSKGLAQYGPSLVGVGPFGVRVKATDEFAQGFYKGALVGAAEHPVKTGIVLGASFILPGAGALAVRGATAVGAGGVAAFAGEGLYYTAPVIYGAVKSKQLFEAPTAKARGNVLGETLSTEVAPAVAGSYFGQKAFLVGEGIIRTWGRTEVPTSKLVPKDVLTGKTRFVETPGGVRMSAAQRKELFLTQSQRLPGFKEPMGYHATAGIKTSELFPVTAEGEGRGLFIAYGVSPNFLRVTNTAYGSNLVGPSKAFTGMPGVAGVIPKSFSTRNTGELGVAWVRAVKPEVEAILPVGTEASLVSKQFYFKWAGVRVPVDVFRVAGAGTAGAVSSGTIASSYSGLPASYALTPSSLFATSVISASSRSRVSPSYYPQSSLSSPTPSASSLSGSSLLRSSISLVPSSSSPISTSKSRGSSPFRSSYPLSVSSVSIVSRISSPSFSSPSTGPYSYIMALPRFKIGFDDRLGAGKIGIRKIRKYTPSIEALFKNIRGKKPTSKATLALGTRPIPKGFKWYSSKKAGRGLFRL